MLFFVLLLSFRIVSCFVNNQLNGTQLNSTQLNTTQHRPSQYKYLFIDFIFLEIYNLIEDPTKECRTCLPPISGYKNESFYTSIQRPEDHINNARMVEMFFGTCARFVSFQFIVIQIYCNSKFTSDSYTHTHTLID